MGLSYLFRLDNQLEQNHQNLFRIGTIYFLSPTQNMTAGYALVNTFNASIEKFYTENRLWEQYQFNKKWNGNKNTMIHRFRLEQRWVEALSGNLDESTKTNYQNRFRYLNRNVFHIAYLKSNNEEIYAVLQDEVFLNLGRNKINSKFIDQNRFLIGLGLNYYNNTRWELGFMNQFVTSSFGSSAMNHTISVSLFHSLDFSKD